MGKQKHTIKSNVNVYVYQNYLLKNHPLVVCVSPNIFFLTWFLPHL